MLESLREHSRTQRDLPVIVAVVAVALLGLNQPLFPGITTGTLVVGFLLPVWVGTLRRFLICDLHRNTGRGRSRGGGSCQPIPRRPRLGSTPRRRLRASATDGSWRTRFAPVGADRHSHLPVALVLDSATYCGLFKKSLFGEPVKYEISVPLAIVLLALASRAKSIAPTLACLVALRASQRRIRLSKLWVLPARGGSRALATTPPINRQGPEQAVSACPRHGDPLCLVLDRNELAGRGYLGKENQQLSVQQIENSGSLLVGGRPEWAGTIRLMQEHPMGFGLGTLPHRRTSRGQSGYESDWDRHRERLCRQLHVWWPHSADTPIVADLWAAFGVVGFSLGIPHDGRVDLQPHRPTPAPEQQAVWCACLQFLGIWDLAFGPIYRTFPMSYSARCQPTDCKTVTTRTKETCGGYGCVIQAPHVLENR